MLKMLQSIWMTAILGALLFAGTLYLTWKKMPKPSPAASKAPAEDEEDPTYSIPGNVDLEALVADLNRRRQEIEAKEQRLLEWEQRLLAESNNIVTMQGKVKTMLGQVEQRVFEWKDSEKRTMQKTAKMIETLEAESAVKLLEPESPDDAAKILYFMKEEKATEILGTMSKAGDAGNKRASAILKTLGSIPPPTGTTKKQ